jgi:hypothetical protein
MIKVCCSPFHIGDRKYGEKEPLEWKVETHGYCFSCYLLEMEEARKLIEELKQERKEKKS